MQCMPGETSQQPQLKRVIGLPGAMMMWLGSIIGTGVFVSLGIGAGIAGPSVLLAIMLAACFTLAFFVGWGICLSGLGLIIFGLAWRACFNR